MQTDKQTVANLISTDILCNMNDYMHFSLLGLVLFLIFILYLYYDICCILERVAYK